MAYRKTLKAAKSTVHAYVSLYSKEKNETSVTIWGMEENTMADGKVEKRTYTKFGFSTKMVRYLRLGSGKRTLEYDK